MKPAQYVLVLLLATSAFAGELEIHTINVGWGSSVFVKGPNGITLLLEAGDTGKGTSEVVPYLQSIGVPPSAGLSWTIAGHQACEHLGGLDEVIQAGYDVHLSNLYNGSFTTNACVTAWNAAAAGTSGGAPDEIHVGTVFFLGDGATATCVAAHGEFIDGFGIGTTDENDNSIALLFQYRGFDYLWASDLGGGSADQACTGRSTSQTDVETYVMDAILPGGESLISNGGIDVLAVNNHGSESSTNANYMNWSRPAFAVISTGAGQGSLQVPRKDVVEKVLRAGAACITVPAAIVLQTEEGSPSGAETSTAGFSVGNIKIKTDGVLYEVSADGAVNQGPNEIGVSGLPMTQYTDDPSHFPQPFPLAAAATGTTQVSTSWGLVDGAHHYEVWRSSNNAPYVLAGSPTFSPFVDVGRSSDTTYLYKVRAVSAMGGYSNFSSIDLATTVAFSNDPLQAGVTNIRATHLNELRTAVNAVRSSAGLSPASFTDPVPDGVVVKAVHVTELRAALDAARAAIGVSAIGYTPIAPGTLVRAVDITQLRNGVK